LRKENEIAKLKLQQEEELIKPCTFTPNIGKGSRSRSNKPSNHLEVAKKLHNEVFAKMNKIKTNEENKVDYEWERSQNECLFSPKTKKLNESIFGNNPIANDNLVKKKVDLNNRARIEKKLNEYQKKRMV